MGRGIDFIGVNLVINYDFPSTAVSYIHRIGERVQCPVIILTHEEGGAAGKEESRVALYYLNKIKKMTKRVV